MYFLSFNSNLTFSFTILSSAGEDWTSPSNRTYVSIEERQIPRRWRGGSCLCVSISSALLSLHIHLSWIHAEGGASRGGVANFICLGVTTCLHPPLNILFNWSRPILSDKISADSSNRLPGWHRCKAEGKAPHYYYIRKWNTFSCQLYRGNFCRRLFKYNVCRQLMWISDY